MVLRLSSFIGCLLPVAPLEFTAAGTETARSRNGYCSMPLPPPSAPGFTVNFLSAKAHHARAGFLEDSFALGVTVVWQIISQVLICGYTAFASEDSAFLWGSLLSCSFPGAAFILSRSACFLFYSELVLPMLPCVSYRHLLKICIFVQRFHALKFFFWDILIERPSFQLFFAKKVFEIRNLPLEMLFSWPLLCVEIASSICKKCGPSIFDAGLCILNTLLCCSEQNHCSIHILKLFAILLQIIQL